MKEITKEDIQLLEEIKGYKSITTEGVKKLQYFMANYIDASCHICPHCSGQIRFAHKRILIWATRNDELMKKVLKPGHRCEICDEVVSDKRRKICLTCKGKQ